MSRVPVHYSYDAPTSSPGPSSYAQPARPRASLEPSPMAADPAGVRRPSGGRAQPNPAGRTAVRQFFAPSTHFALLFALRASCRVIIMVLIVHTFIALTPQSTSLDSHITRLLVTTKQMLQALESWALGNLDEEGVSDVYVKLGNGFEVCVACFHRAGIQTACVQPDFPVFSGG